jgi:hypothetical protein
MKGIRGITMHQMEVRSLLGLITMDEHCKAKASRPEKYGNRLQTWKVHEINRLWILTFFAIACAGCAPSAI